jgi:hypothetical protein
VHTLLWLAVDFSVCVVVFGLYVLGNRPPGSLARGALGALCVVLGLAALVLVFSGSATPP